MCFDYDPINIFEMCTAAGAATLPARGDTARTGLVSALPSAARRSDRPRGAAAQRPHAAPASSALDQL